MCQKPDDLLNGKYTISMPVSTTIDSDQLHHNVIVMGGSNKNISNVTHTDETALMFLLGSVTRYSCNDGFVMTGSNTLMCYTNGAWIGNIGRCESMCVFVCVRVHVCNVCLHVHVCTYVYFGRGAPILISVLVSVSISAYR